MKYLICLLVLATSVLSEDENLSKKKEFVETYVWKDANDENVAYIKDIVPGGHEANGDQLHVCRCLQCEGGHKIPGKINLKEGICRVPFDREEHEHPDHYQVLTNPEHYEITWVPEQGGDTPEGAVPAGEEEKSFSGNKYFICRAKRGNALQLGKVHREKKTCYYPVYGTEYQSADYEILVLTKEAIHKKQEEKKKKKEDERRKAEGSSEQFEIHIDQKEGGHCQEEVKLDLLCRAEFVNETESDKYNWTRLVNFGSQEEGSLFGLEVFEFDLF